MADLRSASFRIFYGPADDPLNRFYIPALSASVRYDRSAGFFSSTALAVAAAGVARLIQNGGRMRLLVGAHLEEEDVAHIARGHDLKSRLTRRMLDHFADPQEALLRQRLEALAWMVADGTLEMRVVLPRDPATGLPLPAHQALDYYHPKTGVFTDRAGDQVAFTGSVNESETAWRRNYEMFSVYFSWDDTRAYLAQVALRFEALWEGRDPDWIALDIPQAVRERLLAYRPDHRPARDPFEAEETKQVRETREGLITPSRAERILFQFVRDAPLLPRASALGAETSAIAPWPHQLRVANAVVQRFPERAMLCDEVGLGKTIEAGLIIRQLILSGRVKRCLILTPKSVLKQWQEELYEKFALDVPRYDGGRVWNVFDEPLSEATEKPWDAFDLLLAGSQLAKRAERRAELLSARPWDLLVVDEAHHARRRDFKERLYRPNRLLSLLNDINARNQASSLLLMTATPMQVHPLEVWDLLTTLGMGGRWGADEDNFLAFFAELRKPFEDIDWTLVYTLVRDHLDHGGMLDSAFVQRVVAEIGSVKWAVIQDALKQPEHANRLLARLGPEARPYVKELAHRHTPLNRYVFRNTRALLREYRQRGILRDTVPTRQPTLKRVPMREDEQALYARIEDYITHFYQKYEGERRGLGFVMTVYRRRLTSSFYAVRRSLERRRDWLRGVASEESILDNDDLEQEELEQDISEEMSDADDRQRFKAELDYVDDFIRALGNLSAADSKLEWLKDELKDVFLQRPTALVFTQYTDTMDYLREQLVEVYGSQVACYSGRGGETWNGIAWVSTSKEEVKDAFARGKVRVLLCTESASEGLNLQTCGVLINYDMPWNPMRVEQRIGRIDRIGQRYAEVWISNYFYQDTIEDKIYQRLADRINWFEVVVGDLQPILAEIGEATRRLAMTPAASREAELEREIAALRQRLQNRDVESLNLDAFVNAGSDQPGPRSPVSLDDLRALLTGSRATGHRFRPHPEIPEAYLLNWRGESLAVTFSRDCSDRFPNSVRFLTYGSALLGEILDSVAPPETGAGGSLLRCAQEGRPPARAWYRVRQRHGRPEVEPVETLAELKRILEGPADEAAPATEEVVASARARFEAEATALRERQAEALRQRRASRLEALRVKAMRLLVKAALVEIAMGRQATLFDTDTYPSAFDAQAVRGLQRHGYPWAPLLVKAYAQGLAPCADDPYYAQIATDSREALKGRFAQLQKEAENLLKTLLKHESVNGDDLAESQGPVCIDVVAT